MEEVAEKEQSAARARVSVSARAGGWALSLPAGQGGVAALSSKSRFAPGVSLAWHSDPAQKPHLAAQHQAHS